MVKKLLAKEPRDRYQSAREALDALSKLGEARVTDAAREIAERVRQYHDVEEARSLELVKSQTRGEEQVKRNLFARQELVSLFDGAVAEINAQLPEAKITRVDSFNDGREYKFGGRIVTICFLDRSEVFRQLIPGLASELRKRNVADAGSIKITENDMDREGWNIVQLQPANAAYGQWVLVETRTSALARIARREIEPFATEPALLGVNLAYHWAIVMGPLSALR
jgi:hypothetical protein